MSSFFLHHYYSLYTSSYQSLSRYEWASRPSGPDADWENQTKVQIIEFLRLHGKGYCKHQNIYFS